MSESRSPSSSAVSSNTSGKTRSSSTSEKPVNIFSADGTFLDRDKDDKKKDQQILARKKTFADRFKKRGRRVSPHSDPTLDPGPQYNTSDAESSPNKKRRLSDVSSTVQLQDLQKNKEKNQETLDDNAADGNSQAQYHQALGSYATSLKDTGTGASMVSARIS